MTTNKALNTPANNSSNWDVPLNANANLIDSAFGGVQSFNLAAVSGNVGVTASTYAGAYPANTASYIPLSFILSGALAGNVTLQIPNGVGGQWIVNNGTSGSYTVTISHASGGTSVVIPQNSTRTVFSDQTNFSFSDTQLTASTSTGQVIYNSSSALVGSANLVFDGTNLTVGGAVKSSSGGIIFPDGSTLASSTNIIPAGSMSLFAASSPPTGYLECNGSLISRTTYSVLFSVIGTTFGAGDGSTTFGIPDMRGYFARGWDHSAGVDPSRTFGSTQADAFASHTHIWSTSSGGTIQAGGFTIPYPASYPGNATNNTTSSTGGTETRPKNVALMYIIKT